MRFIFMGNQGRDSFRLVSNATNREVFVAGPKTVMWSIKTPATYSAFRKYENGLITFNS